MWMKHSHGNGRFSERLDETSVFSKAITIVEDKLYQVKKVAIMPLQADSAPVRGSRHYMSCCIDFDNIGYSQVSNHDFTASFTFPQTNTSKNAARLCRMQLC